MKFTLALFAGAAFAKIGMKERLLEEEAYWEKWSHYLSEVVEGFERYSTKAEHDLRYEIFKDNMDLVETHNSEDHEWTMGITQFADMSKREFGAFLERNSLVKPSLDGKRTTFDASDYGSNPTSKDWVALGAVTPVKNQGSCGSCWAFSTTGGLEGQNFLVNGILSSFSEQELVDCSASEGNNGCDGGLMDYGFTYVEKDGICMESAYSYTGTTDTCESSDCTPAIAAGKVTSYVDVTAGSEPDLETAVANIGPISIAVDANFRWQLYTSGILSKSCSSSKLDHGVLAVGYDNTGDTKYWKVKNSWADTWGEEGYIRIEKDDGDLCGVAESASYPILSKN